MIEEANPIEKTKIGIDEILNEVSILEEQFKIDKTNRASNILDDLISKIKKVNFRHYACLKDEKEKLQKKHYLVSVIEILLKTAEDNNFNLCRKSEMIYLFNSEYWENIDIENFKDFLGRVALKMGVQKYDAKLHTFRDDLYRQFLADAGLQEIKSNSTTTLINLKNGTFEITPKKQFLREFRQSDFMTYQLPFSYDKNSETPLFQDFLDKVLPEKELQNILAEYLGYVFIKNSVLKLEKVLLLYGTGANGKSVLFEIMNAILGKENTTSFSLQNLTGDNGYYRAMLSNKLLNYASEINGKLQSSIFKQLISGEPVEARLPYGNPKIISEYARFMFNCNELPKEVENTNAFFRRFMIIPFRVTIPEKLQDKELSKKIIDNELPGVFNWVLKGLQRLLINKNFTHSIIVKNEVLQYQKESDSVLMFLDDESYQKSIDNYMVLKNIYHLYRQYCIESGYRQVSNKNLSKRLEKAGFKKEHKREGTSFYIEKKVSF
jgi:putative DNA primase/helicase